jgi:hypothetical protein
MLKKRIIAIVVGIALVAAAAGSVGWMTDSFALAGEAEPCACHIMGHNGGSGGGGC